MVVNISASGKTFRGRVLTRKLCGLLKTAAAAAAKTWTLDNQTLVTTTAASAGTDTAAADNCCQLYVFVAARKDFVSVPCA